MYKCESCGCEFSGRKRKHCTRECGERHRRRGDRYKSKQQEYNRRRRRRRRSDPAYRESQKALSRQWHAEKNKDPDYRRDRSIKNMQRRGTHYCLIKDKEKHKLKGGHLVVANAKQAWKWWLKNCPDEWLLAYYDALGRPWSNPRLSSSEKYRVRYRQDLSFQMKERMRNQVRKSQRRDGVAETIRISLRSGHRSKKIERLFDYTIDDLRLHLERQFTRGMSWDRYLTGDIHIDHIRPMSSFDLSDEEQWRACWSLCNLRPMWARDNLVKGSRLKYLL